MILLDGKKTSVVIKQEIASLVKEIKQQGKRAPHLAAVLVGTDGASLTYVGAKVKACEFVGFESTLIKLPENTSEQALIQVIKDLNNNSEIDGFIVQLPLPDQISVQKVIESIDPSKDIDGFTNDNIGSITSEKKKLMPLISRSLNLYLKYFVKKF